MRSSLDDKAAGLQRYAVVGAESVVAVWVLARLIAVAVLVAKLPGFVCCSPRVARRRKARV